MTQQHKKRNLLSVVSILVILFSFTFVVLAQAAFAVNSSNYVLDKIAIGSGGSSSTSTYQIRIITGDTGGSATSTNYQACIGYECGTENPYVINVVESPSSPATYSSGQIYWFNLTGSDDFGIEDVTFESNHTGTLRNYSATRVDEENFYMRLADLQSGNFTYRWILGDFDEQNATISRNYTINNASTTIQLFLNGSRANAIYEVYAAANFTATVNVTGERVYIDSNMTGWQIVTNTSTVYNTTNLTTLGQFNMTGFMNGSANYSKSSETFYATVRDTTLPIPLIVVDNGTNSKPGYTVNMSVRWKDNFAFGNYTFSWNATGTWTNDTAVAIAGNEQWTNVSKALPDDTHAKRVAWKIYMNDSSNNANVSDQASFSVLDIYATVATDAASYNTSGNISVTGQLLYTNGDNIPNGNVSVQILDVDSTSLQSRNRTTILSNGTYNDSYVLGTTIKSGTYKINITAYDRSRARTNTTTVQVFGKTVGQQNHSAATLTANAINQTFGQNFDLTVVWQNTGPDVAIFTNITFTSSTNVTTNPVTFNCGNVSIGGNCTKNFNISISPATAPGTYFANTSVAWRNNDTTTNTSANYTTITVTSSPAINIPEVGLDVSESAGVTRRVGNFTIQSVGNDEVSQINYSVTGGTLPAGWVIFSPSPNITTLAASRTQIVNVTLSIPATASGSYWTNISIVTNNTQGEWLWLNLTTGNLTIYVEAGGPYATTSNIPIIGNVSFTNGTTLGGAGVNISILKDNVQQTSSTGTTSAAGKFSFTFGNLSAGNYTANVTITHEGNQQYNNDTFRVLSALTDCTTQTISFSGFATTASGEPIPSGTVTLVILETGDSKTVGFTNGAWSASFPSCLVTGVQYTLSIRIEQPDGTLTFQQVEFIA